VRGEDKLVDGRELAIEDEKTRGEDERHARRGREHVEMGFEQELAELPERVTTQHEEQTHRAELLSVMRAILEGQKVVVELLRLPQRELKALEALQGAVRAKDTHIDQFVYASDRRDMLEQSLGVLQPTLLTGDPNEYMLGGDLAAITKYVAELRTELLGKEDAQDELLVVQAGEEKAKAGEGGEDDDGDDSDEAEEGPQASGLGPQDDEAPLPGSKRSTLGHEDPPEPVKPGKRG
jgi:hypothetical protein